MCEFYVTEYSETGHTFITRVTTLRAGIAFTSVWQFEQVENSLLD